MKNTRYSDLMKYQLSLAKKELSEKRYRTLQNNLNEIVEGMRLSGMPISIIDDPNDLDAALAVVEENGHFSYNKFQVELYKKNNAQSKVYMFGETTGWVIDENGKQGGLILETI